MLKDKLDEAYDLIQVIQGLKIDSEESDEAIDQWTRERKKELQPYENAIEKLDEKVKYEAVRQKEKALEDKLKEKAAIQDWMRREEEEAENNKRICEERFALQLEEKILEIAEKKTSETLQLLVKSYQI